MKYTAVLSLFLAAVAVADLPYGMPDGKREVEQRAPIPEWQAKDGGHHGGHHPPGTGTGGSYPTGTGGGHHTDTSTGGSADPTGKPGHHHVREAEPHPTTLKKHTGKPHGTGHGTGGYHPTGWPHGTGDGTGKPHKPTETGKWSWPEKPLPTVV